MAKKARTNSWNGWLMQFEVGQREYVECSLENYPNMMRTMNAPPSRRPPELAGWKFSTTLFTAVSAATASDVRYLICVERIL